MSQPDALFAGGADLLKARAAAVTADALGAPARAETEAEILKSVRHKSLVVRVTLSAGPRGTAIAKLCPTDVAERERLVYERVLPALPVSAPRLLGVRPQSEGLSWLILEDAGDVAWSSRTQEHRVLAAEWFAAVHLSAIDAVGDAPLPERGLDYYREALACAQSVTSAAVRNPVLKPDAAGLLERFVEACVAIESEWGLVEGLLAPYPRTLTLPGFCGKNARVRSTASKIELLPFDFENAGWGPPATDLQHVDPAVYQKLVEPFWAVGHDDLVQLAAVGRALVALKSVPGERTTLMGAWPERAVRKFTYYADALERALGTLVVPGASRR